VVISWTVQLQARAPLCLGPAARGGRVQRGTHVGVPNGQDGKFRGINSAIETRDVAALSVALHVVGINQAGGCRCAASWATVCSCTPVPKWASGLKIRPDSPIRQ
jgi:hypothetical protein